MSWKIHDEWIDLARGRHTVVFHNHDTGAEHHLIHEFHLAACPHCGAVKAQAGQPVDFEKHKHETLKALNSHHQSTLQYKETHPHVRIGTGPK